MNKKISKLQISRIIVQIAFLFLLPGLFTLSFSQIGKIYSSIISGNFNLVQSLPYLTSVFATVLITIIFGRFFCGWMCAFGTFNDFIYIAFSRIFKVSFKVNAKLDSALKYLKYIVLMFILYLVWTKGNKTLSDYSPWNAFAQITTFKDAASQYTLGFVALAIIMVGAALVERFFCRYLCPLGGIFAVLSKFKIFKINKPSDKCGACRICTNNCAMGIELYKVDKVSSGECINCLKCIEVCPRKNTQARIINKDINAAFGSAVAVAAFTGVYAASPMIGGIVNKGNVNLGLNSSISSSASASNSVETQGTYKDGTYTGVARGFKPNLKVSVTVKSGKITDIQIVSHNETPRYYEEAFDVVPKEIIQTQSVQVDAVSGATRSSNGIMNAVANALGIETSSSNTNINGSDLKNGSVNEDDPVDGERGRGDYFGGPRGFKGHRGYDGNENYAPKEDSESPWVDGNTQ